jgi:hypothetical protein
MLISSARELLIPRSGLTGWPRFPWRFHDREPVLIENGIRSFVTMKHLARATPGRHIRPRRLIPPAFRAPF